MKKLLTASCAILAFSMQGAQARSISWYADLPDDGTLSFYGSTAKFTPGDGTTIYIMCAGTADRKIDNENFKSNGGDLRAATLEALGNNRFAKNDAGIIDYYTYDSGSGKYVSGLSQKDLITNGNSNTTVDYPGIQANEPPFGVNDLAYYIYILVINDDFETGVSSWYVSDNVHYIVSDVMGGGFSISHSWWSPTGTDALAFGLLSFERSGFNPIPEPATGLLVMGGAAFMLLRRRNGILS